MCEGARNLILVPDCATISRSEPAISGHGTRYWRPLRYAFDERAIVALNGSLAAANRQAIIPNSSGPISIHIPGAEGKNQAVKHTLPLDSVRRALHA